MERRITNVKAVIVVVLLYAADLSFSEPSDVGDLNFTVEHGWPSLPDGHVLGFVTAVDIDSHGHIFAFHTFREWRIPFPTDPIPEATILVWDAEGKLIDSWGNGIFRMPHGLSVDGEDNIWVTDVALNQVMKFSHDGKLELVLGEAGVEGGDEAHFAQPTDVEFGSDRSVYVADGYVNCRIVNFTEDGAYRFEWGECGKGTGQFNIPHDLAIDAQRRVYVADRENDRIQIFTSDGQFIEEWRSGGAWRPYGIALLPGGSELFLVDGGEQPSALPDRSGVVVLDLAGRQIGQFGRFGNQDGQFMMGHDIALGVSGEIYVVDVIGRRLQKFLRDSLSGEPRNGQMDKLPD